jgi:hypothetical protein
VIHKLIIRSTVHQQCQADRFATYADAAPELHLMNRRGQPAHVAMACPHCHGWHIEPRADALAQPIGARHVEA